MNAGHDLHELLRTVIADGDFGVTLRTGEPTVVHTRNGPRTIEETHPTYEEITCFLRRLLGSRGTREFRDRGVTRFMVPLGSRVRVVGAARLEKDEIHVEIRRMAGSSKP